MKSKKKGFCHPERPRRAKGLCGSCYQTLYRKTHPLYAARQKISTTKWISKNLERFKAKKKEWWKKFENQKGYRTIRRNAWLLRKYRITLDRYTELYRKQKGCCALCLRVPKEKLQVDHCHRSRLIRGLLCIHCNRYLGVIDNDYSILERIQNYLLRSLKRERNIIQHQ